MSPDPPTVYFKRQKVFFIGNLEEKKVLSKSENIVAEIRGVLTKTARELKETDSLFTRVKQIHNI